MSSALEPASAPADRQWFIVGRWEEFEGEERANLLRTISIAVFYIVELINYHGIHLPFLEIPKIRERPFHLTVTALAVTWTMLALGVLLCLRRHVFPAALKFISIACDVVFLTCILIVADGPRSPLVAAYFLIIALATLRFSLPLVQFATTAATAGYLFLLGYAKWFARRDIRVPRYHELIVVLALILTGVVLGQVIRRVHALARAYAERVASERSGSP